MLRKILPFIILAVILTACKNTGQEATEDEAIQLVGPTFSGDSALALCAGQCAFGPRTMNSKAHDLCEQWIINKFKEYGCEVRTQKADLTGWDGTILHSTNIIADINPTSAQGKDSVSTGQGQGETVLICAHWDSRPWADNDPDSTNWHKPVMAANDAASGVAVMLELAHIINEHKRDSLCKDSTSLPAISFVCFDAEDYGSPQWSDNEDENSWALGAQYYAKHLSDLYPNGTAPVEGILLDMVGGQGAHFYQEGFSMHYASTQVQDIWSAAASAGYGSYFINESGGTITDDHKPLNEAGIPTVDIISFYPDCQASSFGPTWHTVSDDMQHLDKNVLKAVGQALVQYLYTR